MPLVFSICAVGRSCLWMFGAIDRSVLILAILLALACSPSAKAQDVRVFEFESIVYEAFLSPGNASLFSYLCGPESKLASIEMRTGKQSGRTVPNGGTYAGVSGGDLVFFAGARKNGIQRLSIDDANEPVSIPCLIDGFWPVCSHDGKTLLVCEQGAKDICCISMKDGAMVSKVSVGPRRISSFSLSPKEGYLICLLEDSAVVCVDRKTGRRVEVPCEGNAKVRVALADTSEDWLYVGNQNIVKVFSLKTGKPDVDFKWVARGVDVADRVGFLKDGGFFSFRQDLTIWHRTRVTAGIEGLDAYKVRLCLPDGRTARTAAASRDRSSIVAVLDDPRFVAVVTNLASRE